jgi:hypothetical protein
MHTFICIEDVLSINNRNFHKFVNLIYPDELKMKDITESDKSASYLGILLDIHSNGRLTTSLYDKRYDFDFAIVNFPFLCSYIPLSPANGVYISKLIWYARACFVYENFLKQGKLLSNKLMLQGYKESRLKSPFFKSTFVILTLFATSNYHWHICWMICFIQFVRLSFPYWLWQRVIPYISNFDYGHTAGVTGQQRMFTPLWHLILPLHLSEVRVALHLILELPFGLRLPCTHCQLPYFVCYSTL